MIFTASYEEEKSIAPVGARESLHFRLMVPVNNSKISPTLMDKFVSKEDLCSYGHICKRRRIRVLMNYFDFRLYFITA